MLSNKFHLYCDESIKKGKYYSNFYGGVLVEEKNKILIENILTVKKDTILNSSELKWQKVDKLNYKLYIELIDTFFDLLQSNLIKIRIMFTDNRNNSNNLKQDHLNKEYHLLYYQFIKHAFGFKYLPQNYNNELLLYLDRLPDSKTKNDIFKKYLYRLQNIEDFKNVNFKIIQISEVDSKKHILLQNLDIVLGSIAFKMNKVNLLKLPNNRRGKKTIAKEKVYKKINERIRLLYPNFNIGITTGKNGNYNTILNMPYRHWVFKSN